MSLVRLCDYCGSKITGETQHPILIRVEKGPYQIVMYGDSKELCSWDCVVMYGMRCGGVDRHGQEGGTT